MTRIGIIGGGPGGYEAALVAAQLGAEVTVVDRDGLGGSAVLTDCVPSKTLIATAEVMTDTAESGELGVLVGAAGDGRSSSPEGQVGVDLARVNARVTAARAAPSPTTSRRRLDARGGARGPRPRPAGRAAAGGRHDRRGGEETVEADAVLVATGAHPRVLPDAQPDGERILTWEQVYDARRPARAPDRGRLRRDRGGVRLGVHRARRRGRRWSPAATGCCPARTPTPPRCSRTCSRGAG